MSPQDRQFLLPGARPARAFTRTVALAGGVLFVASAGRAGAQITSCDVNTPTTNGTTYGVGTGQSCTTLTIDNTTLTQTAAGVVNALNGGVVLLNGGTIAGGTLGTSGTGVIRATNNGNNTLSGVTLAGTVDVTNDVQLRVRDGLTFGSGGNIQVDRGTYLSFTGSQTLGGTGSIVFGASGSLLSVDGVDGTTPVNLTVGPNVTIRGQNGTIGQAIYQGTSSRTLTNNGIIQADVAGGTITITDLNSVTNNGTLAAQNGGTLLLQSSVVGGANGQILAGNGSTVLLNGVTVSGQVNTTGTGVIRATNNGNNYLSGVTLNGTVDVSNDVQLRVKNGLTLQNNSTVSVAGGTYLGFTGSQTLGGTGSVVFGANGSSFSIDGADGTAPVNLTVGPNVTVRGQNGTIGQAIYQGTGGGRTLTNQGLILANGDGSGQSGAANVGTITITDLNSVVNTGTLRADGTGNTLLLQSSVNNAGGLIDARNGAVVLLNGQTISGGTITTSNGGAFRATNNGNNTLSGVTLNGTVDVSNNVQLRIANGLTLQNNSTISVNGGTYLSFTGTQTLGGSGTIVLGPNGSLISVDGVDGSTAANVTIGPNVTIRGQNGAIGQAIYQGTGGGRTLTNQGLILANGDGVAGSGNTGTITLTDASFVNAGTFRADGAGNTLLVQATVNNAGGTIDARNGGVVLLNGQTITGGTITTSNGGTFQATNNGNNTLSGVTLAGTVDVTNDVQLRVRDGLTFGSGGNIQVANGTYLGFTGTQTLSGTGSINFGAGGSLLSIDGVDGATPVNLTVGPNVTIQGVNGTIGQAIYQGTSGGRTLTNNGTINSNGGGTITVTDLNSVANNGTLRAQNGTLQINTALSGTGTLQVDPAGVLNIASGQANVSQGTLAIGGPGAALNVRNGTTSITLSADYTNASAGTGNAFNRHAGITNTDNPSTPVQILAGGNVSQTLTGANVTNGTSNTAATLTIGNVRVGGTDYTYNVTNAGTTGPALRGAIQTAANGGNITDTRLSGSGVTASNYGPVAAGTSQGYTVHFTANQAGALAPLSGQVVNLASTYDNIGDANGNQKLNIVLGSGAAAYNAAQGSTAPSPVNLGNTRVGGTLSQTLTVSNVAPSGAYTEKLDASFGANTGAATNNGGAVNLLAAGGSNTSAMAVGVNTGSAGAKTGTVTLNYVTDGTGTSGLANAAVGSQTITVNGNVYQVAVGQLNTTSPYNFGTVQVGQNVSRTLSFTNAAAGPNGYVEDLNVRFGAATDGRISGAGSIAGLAAGSTNAGNLVVSVNTASAGSVTGSIRVNYFSAGAVNGASNGLGELGVGGVDYGVQGTIQTQGTVVDQARPVVNNAPVNLGAARVGGTLAGAVSVTNQATGNQQAALDASFGAASGVTASGSVNLLAPGATDASSLRVALNTATAGTVNGSATVNFVSDAGNIGGCGANCQMAVGSQNVAVTGKVYTAAVGQVNTSTVDFGIVHVGDNVAARGVSVTNAAAQTALNDVLTGGIGTGSAGFTASGSLGSGVAAGATNAAGLTVGLNTSASGRYTGTAAVALASRDADLADLALGSTGVALVGQVNNYAAADFAKTGGLGAFSRQTANAFTLDFGTVLLGSGSESANLAVGNVAQGFADFLNGAFSMTGSGFALGGFNPFTNVGAGGSVGGLTVSFTPGLAGSYSEVVTLNGYGTNASGYNAAIAPVTLTIRGTVGSTVTATPEPSTWALFAAGLGGVGLAARRRRRAAAAA